jgi:hypothetical protein
MLDDDGVAYASGPEHAWQWDASAGEVAYRHACFIGNGIDVVAVDDQQVTQDRRHYSAADQSQVRRVAAEIGDLFTDAGGGFASNRVSPT